jgi:hypothetical protein
MKKKLLAVLLCGLMVTTLCACGGNVKNVKVIKSESSIYTEEDIESAIDTVIRYFKINFSGCTLTEITYVGDESVQEFNEWAEEYGADEAIVLISSFDVDSSGGDGSLSPNSTYTCWQWILVRDNGGQWRHADHGYGQINKFKFADALICPN